METPDWRKISHEEFEFVYEPCDDSFLLIDALESELESLRKMKPTICVEIGCGSGVVITALAKALGSAAFFATDINPHACTVTKSTAQNNEANLEVVQMDLVSLFRNQFDVLVFNPPYVVTTNEEALSGASDSEYGHWNKHIIKSWAGGVNGRLIMDRVFAQLNEILAPNGVAYFLIIEENKPEEIIADLLNFGFEGTIIRMRRIFGEFLKVLKVIRCSEE